MLPRLTRALLLGGLLLVSCSLGASLAGLDDEFESDPERSLDTAIELSEYDYEDSCKPVAEAEWRFLHGAADPLALRQWKAAQLEYAAFKNWERKNMTEQFNDTEFNEAEALGYKLSVIKAPGDAALDDVDYAKLVEFAGENRVLQATARYSDGVQNRSRAEVEFLLAHNAKEEEKLKAWTAWHQQFSSQVDNFTRVLQLAHKAALANGKPDVKSYWEMLSGESNAYDAYKYQLDRVAGLRSKLMNFARNRLTKKYELEMKNDSISAHLLGSLIGNDWTNIAMDVAPEPKGIYDMRMKFWEKKLVGENLYKAAAGLGKKFLAQSLQKQFFENINFKGQCPGHLVNFCEIGKLRLSTCNEPSISNYLNAHKIVAKFLVNQMSSKVPVLNDANRFPVLEEAVAEFFSLLAASPAWLYHVGLIDKDSVESEETKMMSLAITALDVLPRLAYYEAADRWRLEAIEKNVTDPKELLADWWSSRLANEYVSTNDELPTFLSDEYIVNNRPYLSKVLGIVLAFQMYEFIFQTIDVRQEPFDKTTFSHKFVWMVKNNSENWKTLFTKYMGITQVSVEPLSEYLNELEYYFDSYDEPNEESFDLNTKEVELELAEKKERKIFNTPTTSTTTTSTTSTSTTTTTTTTTTARPVVKAKPSKAIPKDSLTLGNSLQSSEKPAESRNYLEDELMMDDEEEAEKPKSGKSTAVWAVAGVLVVIVTICVVAIFGRRRCSRTPKNRRYV